MASFTVCRGLFAIFNLSSFQNLGILDFFATCFYGFKFDLIAVLILNSLYVLIVLFPYDLMQFKAIKKINSNLFLIVNAFGLLSNYIDVAFFKFNAKRSTSETFQLAGGQTDIGSLIPHFLKDYWYLIILFAIHFYFLRRLYLYRQFDSPRIEFNVKKLILNSVGFILVVGLCFVGIRGGFQLVPIGIVNATDNIKPEFNSIVLNSPFTLIKSFEMTHLEESNYFAEEELLKYFNPIKVSSKANLNDSCLLTLSAVNKKPNIVLIIVEGLSKEFTKFGRNQKVTPFLDSLANHSIVFKNMFANGKRSVEGIPAITSSVLSLKTAYINTVYSNNQITSIPNQLEKQGYSSAFYHGGTNGTMNFDSYCASAGYDVYKGRNEYDNERDYDGSWGIWDEEYLSYFGKELMSQKQPFISTIFTLTSHHPFSIPKKYESKFKLTPDNELKRAMSYTDFALKNFFKQIENTRYYKNTIFIITADHTGLTFDNYFYHAYGNYQIPLYLYAPSLNLKQTHFINEPFQQIDILPLIMNLTTEGEKYFSFGNAAISFKNLCITYKDDIAQLMNDTMLYQFVNGKSLALFNTKTDSLLQKNLLVHYPEKVKICESYTKAFIQSYNKSLIRNQMLVK